MGGYNSGRRTGRCTVESGLTFDINRLIRCRHFQPGKHVAGSLWWTSTRTGEKTASLGYEANLVEPYDAWARLQYSVNGKVQDYRIRLTTTPCNYGGRRWWWICPLSGRTTAKLHLPSGAIMFAARQVYRLAYRSQRQDPMDRSHTRQAKLYSKLGGDYDHFEQPPPRRPRGMHHKTYERIESEIYDAMDVHNAIFVAGSARILDRIRRQTGRS